MKELLPINERIVADFTNCVSRHILACRSVTVTKILRRSPQNDNLKFMVLNRHWSTFRWGANTTHGAQYDRDF